jgi:hypothetical protein
VPDQRAVVGAFAAFGWFDGAKFTNLCRSLQMLYTAATAHVRPRVVAIVSQTLW